MIRPMTTSKTRSFFAGYRFPAEIIAHVVWLYFRFPLSLRMVDEMLAARGIVISHETVRQWALKFGRLFARALRRRQPKAGDDMEANKGHATTCLIHHMRDNRGIDVSETTRLVTAQMIWRCCQSSTTPSLWPMRVTTSSLARMRSSAITARIPFNVI